MHLSHPLPFRVDARKRAARDTMMSLTGDVLHHVGTYVVIPTLSFIHQMDVHAFLFSDMLLVCKHLSKKQAGTLDGKVKGC